MSTETILVLLYIPAATRNEVLINYCSCMGIDIYEINVFRKPLLVIDALFWTVLKVKRVN